MGLYDQFPYTNFHELNVDWLLKQMKEAKAKVDDIQAAIDDFNDTYAALAAVFTVNGNNVSIPGTMSANGFSGPLTGNVTGNLIGNVTGNVTGDVTGDLTGNVNGGSFQGSYVEATRAQITTQLDVGGDTEIFNNLTVNGTIMGNLSGNVSGGTVGGSDFTASGDLSVAGDGSIGGDLTVTGTIAGTIASTLGLVAETLTSDDMNDYKSETASMSAFQSSSTVSNHCPTGMSGENVYVISLLMPNGTIFQFAWYYVTSQVPYYRMRYGNVWQNWQAFTITNV